MQITQINSTNNNFNKTQHSNNFKAKVIFQLGLTHKTAGKMSPNKYYEYKSRFNKFSTSSDLRAIAELRTQCYFLRRILESMPDSEKSRRQVTVKLPWIPNCLKMLNQAYQNLKLNEKKEVVGLWNKLYNMDKDKEIVYDINNNMFYVFPKDSVKNLEEKSIEPDKLYSLVFLPGDMSFTKHGSDEKLHNNVNIKSLFELILNEMKKISEMDSSITVENSNKIQVDSNKIPTSIFDHEMFDCFINEDLPNYLYERNHYRQYLCIPSRNIISLDSGLVEGRDYIVESGNVYRRISDDYQPNSWRHGILV